MERKSLIVSSVIGSLSATSILFDTVVQFVSVSIGNSVDTVNRVDLDLLHS